MSVEDRWINQRTGERAKDYGRGLRYRVRNRGARTVSFRKKADATAHDVKVRSELAQGLTPFDRSAGRILFRQYAEKWLREHHYTGESRDTVGSRIRTHLFPTFGDMRMCDIRPSTVTAWLADLRTTPSKRTRKPLAPTTVARVYDALAGIMSSAIRDKVLGENPLTGIGYPAPPKRRRVLTVWESDRVNTLLDSVPDADHAIPLMAATCGHRQGEAFAVAVEDINFLRKEITIRHQVQRVNRQLTLVPCKGQKVRTVPLPDVAAQGLSAHIERYGTIPVRCACCDHVSNVLFSQDGKLLADQVWNPEVWHVAVTAADMVPSRSTGMHQLRHYYASTLIDGGASMKQVQEYMGHASIKITADIYGHLFERSGDKARSIIDQAFSSRVYPERTAKIN